MAKVVNYKEGRYCQLKLDSGERVLISIAQTGIKISKLRFGGIIPSNTICNWGASDLRSAIDIFADPNKPTKHPLDAIRDKLIECYSIEEIKQVCSFGNPLMTATEAERIVQAYGNTLQHDAPTPSCVADVSKLPDSKKRIKEALLIALKHCDNPQEKETLKIGYLQLADFQEDVGSSNIGIDLTDIDIEKDNLENISQQIASQGKDSDKWMKIVSKEQEALKNELKHKDLW